MNSSLPSRSVVGPLLLLVLLVPAAVSAQHLFLDLNGDSLNTSADQLIGTLPVNVDVYLRTDRNRNGSVVSCASGAQPLSIVSYEFILRATGGTVAWGPLTGAPGDTLRIAQNATDLYVGNFPNAPMRLPPGKVRLGRIQVTPLSGVPLLSFATSTALSATYLTSFGTECRGADDDNTMELGKEWLDVNGTFGTLVTNVGGTVYLDRNGSPATCGPESGEPVLPGWTVSLNPGGATTLTSRLGRFEFANVPTGAYTIHLTPPSGWTQTCPPGGLPQVVTVLPLQTQLNLDFGVRPQNSPPVLTPIPQLSATIDSVKEHPLVAVDPDLNSIQFSLAGGPDFASVTTTGPGLGLGLLRLEPHASDAGSYVVAVSASDGTYTSERVAAVEVSTVTGVSVSPIGSGGRLTVSVGSNPMGSAGTLAFRTTRAGFVRAFLYDIRGRRVRILEDRSMAPAGDHIIPLQGRAGAERPLPSGIYFFRVETSEGSDSGRAVIVK